MLRYYRSLKYKCGAFKTIIRASRLLKNPFQFILDYCGLYNGKLYNIETKTNHKYQIRGGTSDRFIFCENYIFNHYFTMGQYISQGDTVVDIGANIGCFAIQAGYYNPKVIYAIEPSPDNYNMLKKNISLNNPNNISTHEMAIGPHNGTIKLYKHQIKGAFHSIYANVDGRSQTEYWSVKVKTLEEFFNEHNIETCDYLKMDCEGAEHDILASTNMDLFKRIDRIALEVHNIDGNFIEAIIEKLTKLGYKVVDQKECVLYARRRL